MVRPDPLLEEFERSQQTGGTGGHRENLRIVEGLYEEARALGIFPLSDPLDGIEVDLRLAKALNVHSPT
ncbi:MAG: hypothetical protein AB1555_10415 [Nitrospirota bacterium]